MIKQYKYILSSNHTCKFRRFPAKLLGTNDMDGFLAIACAIFIVAYNFFIYIWVAPYFFTASFINFAASASASDRMIWALLSS